jgi:predicted NUDIX family phosphoesterase
MFFLKAYQKMEKMLECLYMTGLKTEKILVVARGSHIKKYLNQGCFPLNTQELESILNDGVYGTRFIMEENLNYKQLIPYVAIINNNKVFVYQRGAAGAENKLHAQYSIGVGGHIDMENDNLKSAYDTLIDSCIRELQEEIGLTVEKENLTLEAYINDDSDVNNGVGKVHFGLCFVIHTNSDSFEGEFDVLENRKFMSKSELVKIYDNLEEWSKLFYNTIIEKILR